jgi:hypothetical protein
VCNSYIEGIITKKQVYNSAQQLNTGGYGNVKGIITKTDFIKRITDPN